ncbi:hypothetical protein ACHAP5_003195 [Fusarium lateritium]
MDPTLKDLGTHIKDGTITQKILDNPNLVLENANKGNHIVDHTTFTVMTEPPAHEFGGGTNNIGFLVGADKGTVFEVSAARQSGNANAVKVEAQYWISTVRAEIKIDPCRKGECVKVCPAIRTNDPRDTIPRALIDEDVTSAKNLTFEYNQIQYSQVVNLDSNGLRWPHITVATLAPTAPPGPVCGITGLFLENRALTFLEDPGSKDTVKKCLEGCAAYQGCEVIAYVESSGRCEYFSDELVTDGLNTRYKWYEVGCLAHQ